MSVFFSFCFFFQQSHRQYTNQRGNEAITWHTSEAGICRIARVTVSGCRVCRRRAEDTQWPPRRAAEDTAAVADAVRTVTIVASRDTSRANVQIRPVRNRSAATTASSRVTSAATVRRLPAAVVAMTDFKADKISCYHFS